jgi:hypothetical protein
MKVSPELICILKIQIMQIYLLPKRPHGLNFLPSFPCYVSNEKCRINDKQISYFEIWHTTTSKLMEINLMDIISKDLSKLLHQNYDRLNVL